MSFILDAIAKSERERQQQEIPDARILAMPVSNKQRSRRNIPYYVASALLLSLIVFLAWMQSGQSLVNQFSHSKNDSMKPASTQIATSDNMSSPEKSADDEFTYSKTPSNQDVEPNAVKIETSGIENPVPNPVPPVTKSVELDKSLAEGKDLTPALIEDAQAAVEADLKSTSVYKMDKKRDSKVTGFDPVESNKQAVLIPPAQPAKQTVVENEGEPAPRKITRLSDLPADVRRDLPSVAFTGHLFSKNANLSYVMVDGGRSVIAGQQIADELYLHKVTPTGAIVDFRGFLIETGILQNWTLK